MRSTNTALRWIALACIASATLYGCSGGGGKGSDSRGLLVIDTVPIDGGQLPLVPGAIRGHEIQILFSANPDPASVLDAAEFNGLHANIRLIDSGLVRVPGKAFLGGVDAIGRGPAEVYPEIDPDWAAEIAADGDDVLRFIYDTDGSLSIPEALPAEQYTIVVNDQVTNRSGDPILETYCGAFTSGPDVYPPVVRFTAPVDGAVDIDLNTTYVFEFNEQVQRSSVIGSPPTSPPALTVTAQALGTNGGPNLAITGTITTAVSSSCRYTFTPASPLPGSSPGTPVRVTATVAPIVADKGGNIMTAQFTSSFSMKDGPTISNNPIPPNALWYGATSPPSVGVIGVNSVGADARTPLLLVDTNGDGAATAADDNTLVSTSINNAVGQPSDICLGNLVTPGNAMENIPAPGNPPFPPLPVGSSMPFIGTICPLQILSTPNSSNADIGTYLFVADTLNNQVRVLNSNTSLELASFTTPDPTGLTISQDMTKLFVSNFSSNSVSVLNVRNGAMPTLIKEVSVNPNDSTLRVGRGPKAIISQPDMEDVAVINERDESVSFISYAGGFEVRKTVSSNIGPDPVDITANWRGGTWFAFITNRGGDSISVYESGPNFPIQIGPDDIKAVLMGSNNFDIRQPTKIQCDLLSGIIGDGIWYVNGDGTIGQIALTFYGPPPNPYFPNPAPTRVWGQLATSPSFGRALDLALGDNLTPCFGFGAQSQLKNNFGQISPPIKCYIATENTVRVLDARRMLDMGVEIPVPGVKILTTHWKN